MMEFQYNGKWYDDELPDNEKSEDVAVLKEHVQKILQLEKELNIEQNQQQQLVQITEKQEPNIQTTVEEPKEQQIEQNIQQVNQVDETQNK